MAEVYYRPPKLATIPGLKKNNLEEVFAHHVTVQGALRRNRKDIANDARAILNAAQERTGASQIEEAKGDVDHYVILNDSKAGHLGALAIEFGRGPWRDPDTGEFHPGMEPIAPLGQAAGLKRKRTMPRTPRVRRGGGKKRSGR